MYSHRLTANVPCDWVWSVGDLWARWRWGSVNLRSGGQCEWSFPPGRWWRCRRARRRNHYCCCRSPSSLLCDLALQCIRKNVNVKSFRSLKALGRRWSPFPKALSQTPVFTLRDHGYGASASRGVPVYVHSLRCYSLRLPTEGWLGWVDLGGWLHNEIVYSPVDCYPLKY